MAAEKSIEQRVKDIIVLNNGEKISPTDLETAIMRDPLFEQVMVVGEGCSHLGVLAVVNRELWQEEIRERGLAADWPENLNSPEAQGIALNRIARQMQSFPGYAKIRRVALLAEPWTTENGLLTPTLKLKRRLVQERYRAEYEALCRSYPR